MAGLTNKEKLKRKELFKQGLKKCYGCSELKPLNSFTKHNYCYKGLSSICKGCAKLKRIEYNELETNDKIEQRRLKAKEHYKQNKEQLSLKAKQRYVGNKDKILAYQKRYRENNKEKIQKYRSRRSEKISKDNKEYKQTHKDKLNRYNREYVYLLCTSKKFVYKINTINPIYSAKFKNKKVWVKCYHCKKWYNPINMEAMALVRKGNEGLGNIYCSNKCKQDCKVYGFQTHQSIDPDSKLYKSKSEQQEARNCQTDHLKQLQLDKSGYNYCEKCGEAVDIVELHHTLEVVKFGLEAINSAGHLLVCEKCHKEFTKQCNK